MTDPVLAREELVLQDVLAYIDRQASLLEQRLEQARARIDETRSADWQEQIHHENTVDIAFAQISLDRELDDYQALVQELSRLQAMRGSPYFGGLELLIGGERMEIRIGLQDLIDMDRLRTLVVDWRAPICAAYYEAEVGPARIDTPTGQMDVEILRKRHFRIAGGRLQAAYDSDSAIEDVILGEILSGQTDNTLRTIVQTIQTEQSRAIRDFDQRHLLIHGLAGTGKTSVGLHRLAYLLFRRRHEVAAGDIVILANSRVFDSYVSGVLPNLGEDDVRHEILPRMLEDLLGDQQPVQAPALAGSSGSPRAQLGEADFRGSLSFAQSIRDSFGSRTLQMRDLRLYGLPVASAEALEARLQTSPAGRFADRLDELRQLIARTYESYWLNHRQEVLDRVPSDPESKTDRRALQRLAEEEITRRIEADSAALSAINLLSPAEQYQALLCAYAAQQGVALPAEWFSRLTDRQMPLPVEDASAQLLIALCGGQVAPDQAVSHVLIDEAQDYSPLQLLVLRLLWPQAGFTLLADLNQAILPLMPVRGVPELRAVFGELGQVHLNRSYRSSAPINRLAFRLLEELNPALTQGCSYFERPGPQPEWIQTDDLAAAVAKQLNRWPQARMIGIITDTATQARRLHSRLETPRAAALISSPDEQLQEGVTVVPLALAKGLEFDCVMLAGCIRDHGRLAEDVRRAYVACTRALHELVILDDRPAPAFLRRAMDATT